MCRPLMRSGLSPATLVVLAALAACDAPGRVAAPKTSEPPQLLISDAEHNGLAHFSWQPPLVRNAHASGEFDAAALPEVTICQWSAGACLGAPIATFTRTSGPGATIQVGDGLFQVDWQTNQFNVLTGATYRISVSVAGALAGYADVAIISSGSAKNLVTGEDIPLVDGRTLPIKFRIEIGLVTDFSMAAVSAGGSGLACGLSPAGAAFCWGANYGGGIGNGTSGDFVGTVQRLPAVVSGGVQFATISVGYGGACGVAVDANAWCWGPNAAGQLGNGSTDDSTVPVLVSGGLEFASVSAVITSGDLRFFKESRTCGLTTTGAAYCWGDNPRGQFGNGTTTGSTVPVPAASGLTFTSLSAGDLHTCGVTTSGQAYCWGDNSSGQLGDGSYTNSTVPVLVSGGLSFKMVSVGGGFTCGVTTSGAGYCWGNNWVGLLGNGSNVWTGSPTPVAVSGGLTFATISAGGSPCGITTSGAAYCWGSNNYGQLGTGEITQPSHNIPWPVAGGLTFVSISTGATYACGIAVGNVAYCWGSGGVLGISSGAASLVPVRVGTL